MANSTTVGPRSASTSKKSSPAGATQFHDSAMPRMPSSTSMLVLALGLPEPLAVVAGGRPRLASSVSPIALWIANITPVAQLVDDLVTDGTWGQNRPPMSPNC